MAVNLGILDSSPDTRVGRLDIGPTVPTSVPTDEPEIIHLTVRDLPPTGPTSTGASGTSGATAATGGGTTPATGVRISTAPAPSTSWLRPASSRVTTTTMPTRTTTPPAGSGAPRSRVGAAAASTMTTEPARPTARPAVRRRRRVVAPVGRIVVAGLSVSATFGLVAVMGVVADPATDGLAPAVGPDPAVGGADGARVARPRRPPPRVLLGVRDRPPAGRCARRPATRPCRGRPRCPTSAPTRPRPPPGRSPRTRRPRGWPRPPPAPDGAAAAARTVVESRFAAMGTTARVVVVGGPLGLARDAVADVEHLQARPAASRLYERASSRYAAEGVPVDVDPDTFLLVATAADAWRRTAGRFDPTVYDTLVVLGYDRTFTEVVAHGRLADQAVPGPARDCRGPAPGCAGIVLDAERCRVQLPPGCASIPGASARASPPTWWSRPWSPPCWRAVDLGGDLRARGSSPGGRGWRVEIEDPADPDRTVGTLCFDDGADLVVATSSVLGRRWGVGGRPVHHVIDPPTGVPVAGGVVAATTIAARAWLADVATKVALTAGPGRWPSGWSCRWR